MLPDLLPEASLPELLLSSCLTPAEPIARRRLQTKHWGKESRAFLRPLPHRPQFTACPPSAARDAAGPGADSGSCIIGGGPREVFAESRTDGGSLLSSPTVGSAFCQ